MADDTTSLAGADGLAHLVPPLGRLTFCGLPPAAGDTAGRRPCPQCRALAAERDTAQQRAARR